MALAARYYITSAGGIYIDLSYSRPGFGKPGQEFDIRGGAGNDWLYAPSGSAVDFTQAGTGNDILYVTGNFADYSQSINDLGIYTFTRTLPGGAVETIRFKADYDDDAMYFANGHVVLNLDSSGLLDENAGTFRPIAAADLQPGGTPAHPLTSVPPQQHFATRVYIYQPDGVDIPALSAPGQASVIYGGAGNDCVDVRAGTSVDFSQPGTGMDKLFLSGRLSDYSQSIVDNMYTLTRIAGLPAGQSEVIRFISDFEDDYIYFADGYINLNAEAMQPSGTPLMDPDSGIFRQLELADYVGIKAITALSADTGTSASDFITTVAAQTVSGTLSGVLKAGEVIQVSADGGVSWVNASISGTSWSAPGITLSAGTHQLTTRILDTDGKTVAGASHEYMLLDPSVIDQQMSLNVDNGWNGGDYVTNISSGKMSYLAPGVYAPQAIVGSYSGMLEPTEIIQVSIDGGTSWKTAELYANGGALQGIVVPASIDPARVWAAPVVLLEGMHSILTRIVDTRGNTVRNGPSSTYTLDTTLPNTDGFSVTDFRLVEVNGGLNIDDGKSANDFITRLTPQTMTTGLSINATVNISSLLANNGSFGELNGEGMVLVKWVSGHESNFYDGLYKETTQHNHFANFEYVFPGGGTSLQIHDYLNLADADFSAEMNETLVDGQIAIGYWHIGLTDLAGNLVSLASKRYVFDNAATKPTLSLRAESDTGVSSSDRITDDPTPSFSVTGEDGASVLLFMDIDGDSQIDSGELLGSATLSGSTGVIATTSTWLNPGIYSNLKVMQTDLAGNKNVSDAHAPITINFGTTTSIQGTTANNETVTGTSGNDYIVDQRNGMVVYAGGGNDFVFGASMAAGQTPGSNVFYGEAGNDFLFGGDLSDTLIGGAGFDRYDGGGGDDRIVIDSADLAAKGEIDGGAGIDTLAVGETNLALNIGTVSAGISHIERISLTGYGNNTLTLSAADVQRLSAMNLFNSGKGWAPLGTAVNRYQMVVDGDAGDAVNAVGGWTDAGFVVTNAGQTYAVYHSNGPSLAELLVDTDINRTGII